MAKLFEAVDDRLTIINEPKHITDVGAPDFIFQRGDVAIGWCEAKDIGKDVRKFAANDYSKDQKARYRRGLPNLVYTNGLDFEFIRDGEVTDFISIAKLEPTLRPRPGDFILLENRLRDFAQVTPLSITSSKHLAELMAGKAAIIKDIMSRALANDVKARDKGDPPTDLIGQFEAFKINLIHDITTEDFADIYAETIAYGMFAARLHDNTPETFTRGEALELLPKSNPFLRELFIYIAGPTLDERLRRIIEELSDVFRATAMDKVLRHFGKVKAGEDPFLHFYEIFLTAYNPAKRKSRGVWYTPEPVVGYIVRAVDAALKSQFGLADGMADTSRIIIDWDTGQKDAKGAPATISKKIHRVQILDPATGTGTFLAEVVKLVAERVKDTASGQWSRYVEQDLLPRVHGFEVLMASYAMCHMKLDLILTELGYKPSSPAPRLGVYLTNSLEEGELVDQTLFGLSRAIAEEAKAASDIKRQAPIMCVLGNPPYSGISQNKGQWITEKVEAYKYVDGAHFGERKHWLHDDYVKFIRLAEHMIEKNGEGVLGFITNHGYLDNPTFRGMRWHLMRTFDRIDVLDLHGNANKKEIGPDGSADKNVFDIRQGVAIIVATKLRGSEPGLAEVRHGSLWGRREDKYDALRAVGENRPALEKLEPRKPYYMFYPADLGALDRYDEGFSLSKLFQSQSTGIISARDDLTVAFDQEELEDRAADFLDADRTDDEVRALFFGTRSRKKYEPGDSRGWRLAEKRPLLMAKDVNKSIKLIHYRPFDNRSIWYDADIVDWPRTDTMGRFTDVPNMALLSPRMTADDYSPLITDNIISNKTASRYDQTYFFPLYVTDGDNDLTGSTRLNFRPKLFAKIRKAAGLKGKASPPDGTAAFRTAVGDARPDEVKVFDYIYGVLHSPDYRNTYAEFLRLDFPRIPFPHSPEVFREVGDHGAALRRLHLMEEDAIGDAAHPFEGEGDSVVDRPRFADGKVWINADQSFGDVPGAAWTFSLGGYAPAQKWLKDRKGRTLSWDDIRHYQKILKILVETDLIMGKINLPLA